MLDDADIIEYDFTPLTIPMFYHMNYIKINNGIIDSLTYYAETLAVSHLTVQSGITLGEADFIENDVTK